MAGEGAATEEFVLSHPADPSPSLVKLRCFAAQQAKLSSPSRGEEFSLLPVVAHFGIERPKSGHEVLALFRLDKIYPPSLKT